MRTIKEQLIAAMKEAMSISSGPSGSNFFVAVKLEKDDSREKAVAALEQDKRIIKAYVTPYPDEEGADTLVAMVSRGGGVDNPEGAEKLVDDILKDIVQMRPYQ